MQEQTYKVKVTLEDQYKVEVDKQVEDIHVLMLKGEKGDSGSGGGGSWGTITGTLSDQTDLQTALNAKANTSDLATVATSGSYSDLSNKPTIPTKTSDLTNDSNFATDANYVHTDNNYTTSEKTKLSGIAAGAEVNVQSDWDESDNTSDAYIANKPTIPTVNNGTLTIQKNGTDVQTFTANQSTNATANITVPTATSDLTNDSNFVNTTQLATKQDSLVSGTNIKTINGSSVLGSGDLTVSATVADDSISTAKLQNGAVTAQKIDLTTIRKTLYEGSFSSGTTDLTDDINNYAYIEIYAITNDNEYTYARFFPLGSGNASIVNIIAAHRAGSTDYYVKHANFQFTDNKMTMSQQGEQKTNTNNSASSSNNITVKRVVGWK